MLFAVLASACIPTSLSLINNYYDHHLRARVNSIYCFGLYFGVGLSSLTLIIDKQFGWRNALLITTLIGLIAASTLIFIEEPRYKYDEKVTYISNHDSIY